MCALDPLDLARLAWKDADKAVALDAASAEAHLVKVSSHFQLRLGMHRAGWHLQRWYGLDGQGIHNQSWARSSSVQAVYTWSM